MYQPPRYKKNDPSFAEALIRENPFAEFITAGDRLLATHIPVLIDPEASDLRLFGHIANHNPQREFLRDGMEALLVFRGDHDYVSSSWYREKEISTWDYSAVHVHCTIRLQDEKALVKSLKRLVHHFEKYVANPLEYDDIPDHIVEENLKGITGFTCHPLSVEGIGKWHQGFAREDVANVVKNLDDPACPHQRPLVRDIKREHGL